VLLECVVADICGCGEVGGLIANEYGHGELLKEWWEK
jgi:hypothetical protein